MRTINHYRKMKLKKTITSERWKRTCKFECIAGRLDADI